MKKIIILMVLAGFITSCGPARMKCGPRGICSKPMVEITVPNS